MDKTVDGGGQGLPVIGTARTTLVVLADGQLLCDYRNRNRAHLAPWEPARDEAYYSLPAARADLAASRALAEAGQALQLAALCKDSGAMLASCVFTNIVRGPFQACHLGSEREGHARSYLLIDGRWEDMILTSLVA